MRRVRLLLIPAVAVGLVLAWRHLDLRALGSALAAAAPLPIAIAVVLNLVGRTLARSRRTQLLLGERVSFGALVRLNLAGYAAASVLPGPAEEVVTCTQLASKRGFSLKELLAFQLTDKSLGVVSMGLVALALAPLWIAALVAVAIVTAFAACAPRLLVPLGWLVVSNVLCVAMVALCFAAVGAAVTPAACVAVFFATSATSALVLVPGGIGTFESAFALIAIHQGVPAEAALAAGVLYHLAHVVPPALAGLPELVRISWESGSWTRA